MKTYEFRINGKYIIAATNDNDCGLFIWKNGCYKQLIGTCDFTTSGSKNPRKKVYRKIREKI